MEGPAGADVRERKGRRGLGKPAASEEEGEKTGVGEKP